jgi:hypothetical protein
MFHVNLVIMKDLMYVNVANLVTTCLQSLILVIVLSRVTAVVAVDNQDHLDLKEVRDLLDQ